jgi:hypothetical protein
MRSSYGFKKFLQAIYVVFVRAAIVASHDAGVVSASDARHRRDASLRRATGFTRRAPRATRIFIEKNRLFVAAHCWRPSFAMLLHAWRASGTKLETRRVAPKNRIEKIFKIFSDAIVCARILTPKRARKRLASLQDSRARCVRIPDCSRTLRPKPIPHTSRA